MTTKEYHCPICGYKGDFEPVRGRAHSRCPRCQAKERHRHQFLAYRECDLAVRMASLRVLHVAPESCMAHLLQSAKQYVSFDLNPLRSPRPVVVGDLRDLPFAKESFDLVWVSHVLEHIKEVDQAVSEIHRVLDKDIGLAMLDVPLYGEKTEKMDTPDALGHLWRPGYDWIANRYEPLFECEAIYANRFPAVYGVNRQSPVIFGKPKAFG
jgi:SAM-dependent methyltransferase